MEWFGGKPVGSINFINNGYLVTYNIDKEIINRFFSVNQCGSCELALEAAKEWQYEISTKNKLTKNMIRIVEPPDTEPYLEVKLQKGKIMKCDVDHINLVEDSIWTAWKSSSNNHWYARRKSTKSGQEYALFQSLVCLNYSKIYHVNDDTLDNRSSNLGYGTKMTANNITGVKGVYYLSGNKPSWNAQIGTGKSQKNVFFQLKNMVMMLKKKLSNNVKLGKAN